MYNRQNLPLSTKKIVKKTIQISWLPIIVLLFISFALFLSFGGGSEFLPYLFGLMIIPLVYLIGIILYEYYYYQLYDYTFDDQQGEIKKGVVSRSTGYVRYDRLQNIYVDQDVLDRFLGLYDVHYETAGQTSAFYSHVDGLAKDNADTLVSFLNEKNKMSSEIIKNSVSPEEESNVVADIPRSKETLLTRNECPLSARYIVIASIANTLATFLFVSLFVVQLSLRASSTEQDFSNLFMHYNTFFLSSLLLLFLLTVLYESIWFHNFYFSFDASQGEIRSKVLSQTTSYVQYDRIQNVTVEQSVFERLANTFRLTIETAGSTSNKKLVISGLTSDGAQRLRTFLLVQAKNHHARI